MLLDSKDGIQCDSCGTSYKQAFTYYSLDFKMVEVKGGKPVTSTNHVIYSLDYCEKCMAGVCDQVKRYYKPTKIGVNCDLNGAELRGDFLFYTCNVSKVSVQVTANQKATTQVDRDHLELVVCDPCYTAAVQRQQQLRRITSEFTSTS